MSGSEFNPFFPGNYTFKAPVSHVGDFTPFYIVIAICSVILGSIIILNTVFCCSRYSKYWLDKHTGNRWLVSIWSATPHNQPSLDYSELNGVFIQKVHLRPNVDDNNREDVHPSISQQPLTSSQEYLELSKRESDI